MTGVLRILVFILFGYIIYKAVKFVFSVFTSVSSSKAEEKVKQGAENNSKIDKKDVIEAQFEEIDDKEDPSAEK